MHRSYIYIYILYIYIYTFPRIYSIILHLFHHNFSSQSSPSVVLAPRASFHNLRVCRANLEGFQEVGLCTLLLSYMYVTCISCACHYVYHMVIYGLCIKYVFVYVECIYRERECVCVCVLDTCIHLNAGS